MSNGKRSSIGVVNSGCVANFEIRRGDGHTLSLAQNGSLIHWASEDEGGGCVSDYGPVFGADRYLNIVADFLGKRITQLAPFPTEITIPLSQDSAIALEA